MFFFIYVYLLILAMPLVGYSCLLYCEVDFGEPIHNNIIVVQCALIQSFIICVAGVFWNQTAEDQSFSH